MKSAHRKQLAAAILLATASASTLAQTSSSIRGVVTGPDGQPAQASVTIIHTPSGSVSEVETNESGRFNVKGLRVGGPYQIIVDSDVYADDMEENVYLQLGKAFKFARQLGSDQAVEEVEVFGSAIALERNAGGSSSFGLDTIERAPNMDRDISAYVRMNPLVNVNGGSISIAGSNNRLNSFNVDGVAQNDSFGLNSNGYPTGRSPISMDAVEQVTVDYSPYNVRAGGFSGGLINAVTKSGTNEFHGSIFFERQSDALSGGTIKTFDDNGHVVQEKDIGFSFEEVTRGASLSGPIIEDTLFFFVNYEDWERPIQGNWGPANSGASFETGFTQAEYDRVVNAAQDLYGLTLGGWQIAPVNTDEKILAKLDWEINADHRMDITYQNTESVETQNFTNGQRTLYDATNSYVRTRSLESWATGFYSTWTDNFSTEIRASYKESNTLSPTNTREFGQITIQNANRDELKIGADANRHLNTLNDDAITFEAMGEYLWGDHTFVAGLSFKENQASNVYLPHSLGTWSFRTEQSNGQVVQNGLDVFTGVDRNDNGELYAPRVQFSNSASGDPTDAAAAFTIQNFALFAEDTYQFNDQLLINFGLRYEQFATPDVPDFNTGFAERYALSNQHTIDGKNIWLPRVGFEYEAADWMTVSGGVGRFSGGQPNVWIGNTYSKDGLGRFDVEQFNVANPDFARVNAAIRDDITRQVNNGEGPVVALDPDFELPSEWRTSLNVDVYLPYEVNLHLGVEKAWKENSINIENLAKRNISGEAYTADGRAILRDNRGRQLPQLQNTRPNFDLLLTNANENGQSTIVSTSLSKDWDNGLFASVAYTYQDITNGFDGDGNSNVEALYSFTPGETLGQPLIDTSVYEVKHRFTVNLGYRAEYFDGFASSVNLFFERRPGERTSYIMNGSELGELRSGEALLPYIPNGPEDTAIVANAAEVWGDLQTLGLDQFAGGYAEKNAFTAPWYNVLDFSFQQEIPNIFMDGHKGILSLTMENVLSFLDDKKIWDNELGYRYDYRYSTQRAINYDIADDGRYIYQVQTPDRVAPNLQDISSGWQVKLGLRYSF